MNEIMLKEENGQVLASSREVAEKFGKEHSKVKRSILALKEDVANFGEMFIPSLYIDSYGRKQEDFSMNVERGISLGYFRTHSIHFHQFITTYNRIFV